MGFIDKDLINPDFTYVQQIILARSQPFQLCFHPFFHAFDPLARDTVVTIKAGKNGFVRDDLILDHLAFKSRFDRNELESIMRNDDRVPVFCRRTGNETLTFGFNEIGFVGHHDPCRGIKHEKLTRHLCKAMTWHHNHGLADQSKPFLLHDGRGHGECFPRSHGMRHVGAS
ncbi:hypothetical protein NBRC3188_3114 [Acetobacter pasteurianus NBRC 3188]|uniref:Uncharacterized protein n=1 Tax=Acetobacter pasteurianus NBRC 3188 TaxID=1226663 RepID=A0A401WYK2_ACEPA|nr:hypothetical protein NBRC3188_3114 [Acetobacter pasteurianus NBRC 3188]